MPTQSSIELSNFTPEYSRRRKHAMFEEDLDLFQDLNPMYAEILNVFSKTKVERSISTLLTLASDGKSAVDQVKDSVKTTSKYAKSRSGRSSSDSQDKASQQMSGQVIANLKQHAKLKDKSSKSNLSAVLSTQLAHKQAELYNLVPHIITKIIKELNPATKEIKAAVSAAKTALKAALAASSTSNLSKVASSRTASDVIERIRSEIKSVAIKQTALLTLNGGLIALKVASLGVGTVVTTIVNAVIAVFNFLKGIYDRWVMELKYICFQEECRNLAMKASTLTNNWFETWFATQLEEIPILASYIVCIPEFGSFPDFIKITDLTPPPKTLSIRVSRCFKRKYHNLCKSGTFDSYAAAHEKSVFRAYEKLQEYAKGFISDGTIKLDSTDPKIVRYLNAAKGKRNYIPGCNATIVKEHMIKKPSKQTR